MIPLPSSLKITHQKDNQSTFEIEGLYPGYGITLGNTLRRILLSSLEAVAVTSIQIDGIPHEFSTLPGVKEDMVQVILNFKKLKFKTKSDESQEGSFEVKGVKEVKGQDLILPSQVEIVNPKQPLVTLTSKTAKFVGRFKIEKGIGYQSVEQRRRGKAMVGEIPIDSIFTPVERVSFRVEQMRVEDRTDFNRLLLTIRTDGTIPPKEAFLQALDILEKHLNIIEDGLPQKKKEKSVKKEKSAKKVKKATSSSPKKSVKKTQQSALDTKSLKIEELNLSQRVKTILIDNHFKTVGGLLAKDKEKLSALKGISEKGVAEIEKVLKKLKLHL